MWHSAENESTAADLFSNTNKKSPFYPKK